MDIHDIAEGLAKSCQYDGRTCTVFGANKCPFWAVGEVKQCGSITAEQWEKVLTESVAQSTDMAISDLVTTQEGMEQLAKAAHEAGMRGDVLIEALSVINGERQDMYGHPEFSFQAIAGLWSVYLGLEIRPRTVAMMMALMKIARITTGTDKRDSYIDACGYLALAADMAGKEAKE